MNKSLLLTAATALLSPLAFSAQKAPPPASQPAKLLLSEDFNVPSLPANWRPGGRPKSFSIVDGALQGVCAPDDDHGPAISAPVEAHDLTIQFSVRLLKPGLVLFLVDGDSQFGGTAHLLRVALGAKFAALQQDRGSLESKQAQAAAKKQAAKEGRKPPTPTREQLADDVFETTYSNGQRVVVNYREQSHTLSSGDIAPPRGWLLLDRNARR